MRVLKRASIILVLVAASFPSALTAEGSSTDAGTLRRRLLESVGTTPWNLADGYSLEGRFVLKATGEEIDYQAKYARSSDRWAADFSQENRSRNLRYVFSGKRAWVSSPEITTDVAVLPYMAQFDFPQLYNELLRILERGTRDPAYAVDTVANEIHVRGRLHNGWGATFVFNTVEYFPRKVRIAVTGEPSAAWLLAFARPDGSCSLVRVPGPSTEFEIWLSDPIDAGGYRYARRIDFVDRGNVVGTFLLGTSSLSRLDVLFDRPPRFPWSANARFVPQADLSRPSLYLDKSELPAFRSRIQRDPWSGWARENSLVAFWAILMLWIGRLFPATVSLRLITLAVAIGFLGFLFLLLRRRRQFSRAFPWPLLATGILAGCFVLVAGTASHQLHRSRDRSLIALHSAIRYTVTGHSFYARRADALLRDFASEAPAQSMEDLGQSCQAYAIAYDLIRGGLPRARRMQIEKALFDYAGPLFGASHGWASNMESSGVLSAGLGMAGLAISCESYTAAACEVMDRVLKTQLAGGLHQAGPGKGSLALDSAANFFFALKHAGLMDYYSHTGFQQYVRATLQMLSPVGTLPLFGDTSLDQSERLSMLFLKVANQLPGEDGGRCVTAHDLYWANGRYSAGGLIKWILPAFQPMLAYFENPYVLFQYARPIAPSRLPQSSVVLGEGQSAVLRSGTGPDSVYLALNATRSNPQAAHRDILSFDLYAYQDLLLHGPGYPGNGHPRYAETTQTAASNSITMNNESQSAAQSSGIESSLLNQPLFDYLRALADKTYDYGQVQRDIVMVRPEKNHPAYFFLMDNVFVSDPATTVQWHLHGRGKLAIGIDRASRWTSNCFSPPRLRSLRASLEAAHPMGTDKVTTQAGELYSQIPILNQDSSSTTIEWTGSRRFCTILLPYKYAKDTPRIVPLGGDSCRVGTTDWISLGSLEVRITLGPLVHISQYTLVRDRPNTFPALLMISGVECRFGRHSILSTKPVTASLNGLRGGFLNSRPDTRVEIHSPEIRAGDRFRLDEQPLTASEQGVLIFTIGATGEHSFHPIS